MEKNTTKITSNIQSINCTRFITPTIPKSEREILIKSKFAFEFNIEVKTDIATKQVTIGSFIKIYSDDKKTLCLGEIDTTGVFHVENYSEVSNGNPALPINAISMFVGVLIGTTRGILIERSKGTLFEGVFMPIVDATAFFRQPESIAKAAPAKKAK